MLTIKSKMFFILTTLLIFYNYSYELDFMPNDEPFDYQYDLPKNTYHKYCKNIYSQNGEDGILEQILKELDIKNGTFCEFGASDGKFSSNTFNLLKNHNFTGMVIESNKSLYEKCVENYKQFSNVKVFHGLVLYNNKYYDLNAWLKKGNLPYDFDILSIDIDYDDYYVWKNLTKFNPKIVIIETNPYRDPIYEELPGNTATEYNLDLLKQWHPARIAVGCSFISAIKLGLSKGYIPLSYTGNITFIRKDLIHKLQDFPYIISDNPYDYITLYSHLVLWGDKWMTNTGLILDVAIRDYYLQFKKNYIDVDWLKIRMREILNNFNVIF